MATGDIEDAPGLDGLHSFPVKVEGGMIKVGVPKGFDTKSFKRTQGMCSHAPSDSRVFVILGAGAAGAVAAETLRQEGYAGRILLVMNEPHLPYDRIKLSKNLSATADQLYLRSHEFYAKHGIEVLTGVKATAVDTKAKVVTLSPGGEQRYDSLLISTGGYPRTITTAPGHDLQGIFTLRVPEDAAAIDKACEGAKTVVVVGSSFIGMEAAACLKQSKKIGTVHVIGMEAVPFERVLGAEVGAAMQKVHEAKGKIAFHMKRTVKEFKGTGGKVSAVVLDNDELIPCDFCVVGAGIIPGTQYLNGSGLTLERDGSIITDDRFRAAAGAVKDVYVAGDIARFPYWATGETIRIEHWDVAQQQGRVAAANMAGKDRAFTTVPFFWTTQYGLSLRYAGNNMAPDEVIIKGSLDDAEKMAFVAYYATKGKITAVATLGADPVAAAAAELIRKNEMPTVAMVKRQNDILYLSTLTKPIAEAAM